MFKQPELICNELMKYYTYFDNGTTQRYQHGFSHKYSDSDNIVLERWKNDCYENTFEKEKTFRSKVSVDKLG